MSDIASLPELALPAEVARALRCSTRYIQAECAAGRLGARKIAGRFLIPRDAVSDYLEQQKVTDKCQKETQGQNSSSEKRAEIGKSSGMSRDAQSANLRAQLITQKLLESSRNTSPAASVIHLSSARKNPKIG